MKELREEAKRAVQVLKDGGIILYPTDTVWGIGCDAGNESAVRKLLELKKRSSDKGLVLLLDVPGRLESFVRDVPANAWDLIEYAEHPLTIIYDKPYHIAPSALAADGSAGIRITKDPFCRLLVEQLRRPVVSTSANTAGNPFPKRFSDIDPHILSGADYIVNLRRNEQTEIKPSTVMRMKSNGQIEFLRP
jgi:L-threonylcarbamoyladenylate synthase